MHNRLDLLSSSLLTPQPLVKHMLQDQFVSARAYRWSVFCTRQSYIPQTKQGLDVRIKGVCIQGRLASFLTRHHLCFARQLHMLGCHTQDVLDHPFLNLIYYTACDLEEAAPTAIAAGVSTDPCEVGEQAAKTTQCSSQSMRGCPQQQSSERAISKHMAMSEG